MRFILSRYLSIFRVDSPTNDQSSNFAGASPYFVQLGISQISPSWIVIDVSIAPQYLNCVQSHLSTLLSCVQYDPSAVFVGEISCISSSCYTVGVSATSSQFCEHICHLCLYQLKFPYFGVELSPFMGICKGSVTSSLHNAKRTPCEDQSL